MSHQPKEQASAPHPSPLPPQEPHQLRDGNTGLPARSTPAMPSSQPSTGQAGGDVNSVTASQSPHAHAVGRTSEHLDTTSASSGSAMSVISMPGLPSANTTASRPDGTVPSAGGGLIHRRGKRQSTPGLASDKHVDGTGGFPNGRDRLGSQPTTPLPAQAPLCQILPIGDGPSTRNSVVTPATANPLTISSPAVSASPTVANDNGSNHPVRNNKENNNSAVPSSGVSGGYSHATVGTSAAVRSAATSGASMSAQTVTPNTALTANLNGSLLHSVPRRKTREAEVSFAEFPTTALVTTTSATSKSQYLPQPPQAPVGSPQDTVLSPVNSSNTNQATNASGVCGSNACNTSGLEGPSQSTAGVLPLPHVILAPTSIGDAPHDLARGGQSTFSNTNQGSSNPHSHRTTSHHSGTSRRGERGGANFTNTHGNGATMPPPENAFGAASNTGSNILSGMNLTDSSITSAAHTTKTEEMSYLFGSCHIPLNLAVMFNIFVTVALVAVLSIFPLNSVSIRSMDHVTSTLSASLAKTLAESIDANMYFLPLTVKNFASAWQVDRITQAWNWTNEDMPFAMQHMCEMTSFSRPFSHLLYITISSPYTGYSAYCSPQFSDDFLVGRHITTNASQYRYIIDPNTFQYTEPPEIYTAVLSMNTWETTVEFGGEDNPWHQIAVPWYQAYLESLEEDKESNADSEPGSRAKNRIAHPSKRSLESLAWPTDFSHGTGGVAGAGVPLDPHSGGDKGFPPGNTPQYRESGWWVFSHDNVSVITYSIPFVDYAGNLAMISAALQPAGIVNLFPDGILSADIGSAMVIDPETGLVMVDSWGQDTRVYFDTWNLSDPEGLRLSKQQALYMDKIDNDFMRLAVEQLGGRKALANKPPEVTRWQVKFKLNGDEALALATRLTDHKGALNLIIIYAVKRSEYTANIDAVRTAAIVSVIIILLIIALVDLVLVYLFLQPLRDVAAGLHDASQLKDGSGAVEGRISIIKEVADMQYHFKVMNGQLMRMKAFLPQGVLHPLSAWSGSDAQTDSAFGESYADDCVQSGQEAGGESGNDADADAEGDGAFMLPVGPAQGQEGGSGGAALGRHGAMHLNERALHDDINKFRRRYCSVVTFFLHIREADVAVTVIDNLVAAFMHGVIPSILRHGGVIEIHRPEAIMVSFAAHNRLSMHQSRAAKCALEAMEVLNQITAIGPRVGCLLDVGEFYVGTCGAEQRYARVAFGARTPVGNDLVKLSKSLDCQVLATQRFAAALDEHLIAMPVDSIMFPLTSKYTILYELRGSAKMLSSSAAERDVRAMVQQVKIAFHKMMKGDYGGALENLEPYASDDCQVARLTAACRTLAAKGITKPFVRTIGRVKLSEADTQYDITDEADGTSMVAYHSFNHSNHHGNSNRTTEASSHGPGASSHGSHNANETRWRTMRKGTFRKSPQSSPGLDSTLLLLSQGTTTNTRVIEARSLHENVSTLATTGAGSPAADSELDVAASLCESGGGLEMDASTQSHSNQVAVASANVEEEGDDGALFEMFIEDEDDDTQTIGDGGYGTDGGTVVSASNATSQQQRHPQSNFSEGAGNGELPVQFVDFEGNRWTRSTDRLGQGAFSIVYRGLSQSGNLVALKCFQLRARNVDVHAIREEVSVFANLHHENIVQYVSIYVSEFYIIEIMEFVPGGSLDTLLTSFGSLSKNAMRRYLRDILRGLSYLHSMGIVHCDIKPHNVLLAMDGQCKLSDFGSALARATTSVCKIDDVLEMRGTPGYMAPEVARGEVPTVKSDVFSLGVAVLELLTGRLPWQYVATTQSQQQCQPRSETGTPNPADASPQTSSPAEAPPMSAGMARPESTEQHNKTPHGSGSGDAPAATHALVSDYTELQTPNKSSLDKSGRTTTASSSGAAATGSPTGAPGGYFGKRGSPTGSAQAPTIPIEQVLRNAVNLISSIGRGVVHPAIPDSLDDDVRDFLQSCVHVDPAQRATVDDLLNHPWLM